MTADTLENNADDELTQPITELAGDAQTPIDSTEDANATGNLTQAKLILEAALLSSSEPLQLVDLRKLFDQELSADTIRKLLDELKSDWADRAVELCPVASGWRFRVKPEFARFVQRMSPEKPPRYSRAVMETLAIIAYRQPATRGDVAQIRGVEVSSHIIKALEERGWIEAVGHREVPGRPALYATTKRFLDDLNLRSLEELPPLEALQTALNLTTDITSASTEAPSADMTETTSESNGTAVVDVEPTEIIQDTAHAPEEANTFPPPTE